MNMLTRLDTGLAANDTHLVRPKLTVYIHLQDGIAVDASLTPTSRLFFERIAADLRLDHTLPLPNIAPILASQPDPQCELSEPQPTGNVGRGSLEIIEVPLVFDSQFFDILQSDVNNLDALQAEEERELSAEVIELGKQVSLVSRPSRFSRSDIARWRRIFELYLDAQVFFATNERDHGRRSSPRALEQLKWFQAEVEKRQLAKEFRLRESSLAFSSFLNLNSRLLKNLQFQELNRLAVFKILKSKPPPTIVGE